MMVGLCRDHNFMRFKFDGVCGSLREDKRDAFDKMMTALPASTPSTSAASRLAA